jgi:predicted DNA-binding antitoxin AbrB/MazE fold protein
MQSIDRGKAMVQTITARFEDGVLKLEGELNLPPHARVRLADEPLGEATDESPRTPLAGIIHRPRKRMTSERV